MYSAMFGRNGVSRRSGVRLLLAFALLANTMLVAPPAIAQQPGSVVRNLSQANERLEMTVNTSQILTLGTRIPRIVVNNPDLVTATPVSETQVQIAARKPGVTQINLWDENGEIYTVDLLIFGDVRELEVNLQRMFPSSSLRVIRLTNSLVLEGQVDRPEIVSTIRQLAEDYAPKIVNNITVGGAQQVVLKVKVMEVSRTKLRELGVDFSIIGDNGEFASGVSGILGTPAGTPGGSTIHFGVFGNDANFNAFIRALQTNRVAKTLADPTLVTVSGRPARFQVGGEIPVPVPQSSNGGGTTITIEYKDFGTIVDFVPIVLGNGRIRLEVRPDMSELDYANAVTISGNLVPGLKRQMVDTGVEMSAGQTLAIAGLIQEKVTSENHGLPYISDIPYLGVPFRRMKEDVTEIESLVLVTPDFAEGMDSHEVPPCGPGMETMSPSNCDLYWKGMNEVPACGPCGASEPCVCNAPGLGCNMNGFGPCGGSGGSPAMASDAAVGPQRAYRGQTYQGAPYEGEVYQGPSQAVPGSNGMPAQPLQPQLAPGTLPDPAAHIQRPQGQTTPAAHYNPINHRSPNQVRQASGRSTSTPGLIGPIGYDVQK